MDRPAAPSFRAIFESESSYVWNTLQRLGVHSPDLEDVTHEVFLVVHRRLGDYDPERPLRPWLFGIMLRMASHYRKLARHRREVMDGDVEAVDEAPAADAQIELRQAQELVLAALAGLDLDRRAVFVMHDLDGQAMPEIAAALGVPLNTAYSRLRLAREQFRAAVHRLRLRRGERGTDG